MSTRLRAQDAVFLAEETVYAPRQVATLAILDPGPDGFDVLQCRVLVPEGVWGPDTCPVAGGLDQNIYGRVLP